MKKIVFIIFALLILSTSCTSKKELPLEPEPAPLPPAEAEKEPPKDEIKEMMGSMTLDEKLGQMVMAGFDGVKLDESTIDLIANRHVGGVILFKRNIEDKEQLTQLIAEIKSTNEINKIPLFIAVDEEGGSVSRLPEGSPKFPSSKSVGKKGDRDFSYSVGQNIGEALASFGINLNFAPVLDILSNQKNTVIGSRAFGSDPQTVSEHGIAVMEGLQSENIIPVIKHFPGHGDTKVDSHVGLPVVNFDKDRLNNFELIPFKEAIAKGADAVMAAHIAFPKIDESNNPATMSKIFLTDILREELGFNGVIITDDMEMGAIIENYDTKESILAAVEAGADILLLCHSYEKQILSLKTLKDAVEEGRISMERIDKSVERILRLKAKYNFFSSD